MKPGEKKLRKLFEALSAADRETLLAFAEFLLSRNPAQAAESQTLPEPRYIPRPQEESVVGAIKRLNATYYMLENRAGLLDEGSVLMTQHVMQGRDLGEVIDELEAVFAHYYREWLAERQA